MTSFGGRQTIRSAYDEDHVPALHFGLFHQGGELRGVHRAARGIEQSGEPYLAEEFVSGYTSSSYRDAIAFTVLILVLLVRPEGLLGRVTVEKV